MTSSAFGIAGIARIMSSNPLRGTSLPTLRIRFLAVLRAIGPLGVKRSLSTPHGTTEIRALDRPIRINSKTSSVHVADTQVAVLATMASSRSRSFRAGVWCTVMSPLHDAERMERLDRGQPKMARRQLSGDTRHPEVSVCHGGSVGVPTRVEELRERAHML